MPAALWTIVSSPDGTGPYIGIIADKDGAEYVGTKNRRLSEKRVEAIADSRDLEPRTAAGWLLIAKYGLGPVKLTKPRAVEDRDAAREAVKDAILALSRRMLGDRAQKLAGIAEDHYLFSLENGEAWDADEEGEHPDYPVWNADYSAEPSDEREFIESSLQRLS